MGYLPLFLDATARPCAVIGGDELAEERVRLLLAAGAIVTVISPTVTATLAQMHEAGQIAWRARSYQAGDLRGCALAFHYHGDDDSARGAAVEAHALNIPFNVADQPALCSFIMPAVVRRGALQIAIGTGGASPALAKILRQELEAVIGPEYELLLEVLAAVRPLIRQSAVDGEHRGQLAAMLAAELREALRGHDDAALDEVLTRRLGVRLSALGIALSRRDAPAPRPDSLAPLMPSPGSR